MPALVVDNTYSERGYLAPTVYLKQGVQLPRWNYYNSRDEAFNKLLYLTKKGSINPTPAGTTEFLQNGSAQTFGINVDFYAVVANWWQFVSYAYFKNNFNTLADYIIFRFYTTDGGGPYWSIFNKNYFGISATKTTETDPARIQALDSFYREVALLKYRYNALAGFLNSLAKRQLNSKEQMIFNQAQILLNNLRSELNTIKGIEITFTSTGAIGVPIFLVIGIIAILSIATAWTISAVMTEREKSARINASYDLNKWVAQKKTEIATLATAGTITADQEKQINETLDGSLATANKVAENSSKSSPGLFGEIGGIVKWGVIGIVAIGIFNVLNQRNHGTT